MPDRSPRRYAKLQPLIKTGARLGRLQRWRKRLCADQLHSDLHRFDVAEDGKSPSSHWAMTSARRRDLAISLNRARALNWSAIVVRRGSPNAYRASCNEP